MNNIISHNSGKTFICRGFMDRASRGGYNIILPVDVKDEMKSSIMPVQEKFASKLLKDEKPQSTNVMTFRPSFFLGVKGYSELPSENYWYTPALNDISQLDFMTLLNAEQLTEPQRIAVTEIYEELKNYVGDVNIDVISNIIDNLEGFDERQKNSLKTKFYPLKYSKILDKDTKKGLDFERLLKAGTVLALNMNGFDNITRDNAGLPQVYYSIWLRKIISLRRQKKIKPVIFIVDEASRFIPAQGNPSSKIETAESVDLDGRHGIQYLFLTQSPFRFPEDIIRQCRYYLLPYSTDIPSMVYIMKISGVVSWSANVYAQRCAQIKKQLKKFQWLFIDRNTNEFSIITAISPLSCHMETSQ